MSDDTSLESISPGEAPENLVVQAESQGCCAKIISFTFSPDDTLAERARKLLLAPVLVTATTILLIWFCWITLPNGVANGVGSLAITVLVVANLIAMGNLFIRKSLSLAFVERMTGGFVVGVILLDWGAQAGMSNPCWAISVLLMDMLLLVDARDVAVNSVFSVVMVWLFLTSAETGFRFFLFDNAYWGPERTHINRTDGAWRCDCENAPCPGGVAGFVGGIFVNVFIFGSDFIMTRNFARGMRKGHAAMQESITMAVEVAEALVKFDLDAAEVLVAREDDHAPDELKEAFLGLLENLRLYKPFLPDTVLRRGEGSESSSSDDSSVGGGALAHMDGMGAVVDADIMSTGSSSPGASPIAAKVQPGRTDTEASTNVKGDGGPVSPLISVSKMDSRVTAGTGTGSTSLVRGSSMSRLQSMRMLRNGPDRESTGATGKDRGPRGSIASTIRGGFRGPRMSTASSVAGFGKQKKRVSTGSLAMCAGRRNEKQRMSVAGSEMMGDGKRFSIASMGRDGGRRGSRAAAGGEKRKHHLAAVGLKRRQVTVVNCNARGFLRHVETAVRPGDIAAMHALVLQSAMDVAQEQKGACEGFNGDHVYLSFNTAVNCVQHRSCAVRCAHAFISGAGTLHTKLLREALPMTNINAAVVSGAALCGNIGTNDARRFQALGGTSVFAHIAERCGASWDLPLVVDGTAYNDVVDIFTFRLVDLVVYSKRGSRAPAKLWELVLSVSTGRGGAAASPYEPYNQALEDFYAAQYDAAQSSLDAVLPAQLAAEHCTVQNNIVADLRERIEKARDGVRPAPRILTDVGGLHGEVAAAVGHPPGCKCPTCTMREMQQSAEAQAEERQRRADEEQLAQEQQRQRKLAERRAAGKTQKRPKQQKGEADAAAVAPAPAPATTGSASLSAELDADSGIGADATKSKSGLSKSARAKDDF